jgi:hypothetical protein
VTIVWLGNEQFTHFRHYIRIVGDDSPDFSLYFTFGRCRCTLNYSLHAIDDEGCRMRMHTDIDKGENDGFAILCYYIELVQKAAAPISPAVEIQSQMISESLFFST